MTDAAKNWYPCDPEWEGRVRIVRKARGCITILVEQSAVSRVMDEVNPPHVEPIPLVTRAPETVILASSGSALQTGDNMPRVNVFYTHAATDKRQIAGIRFVRARVRSRQSSFDTDLL